MKIKSLHIASFGGIKNLDLNLDDSLNVIYGDNENGKTTIMTFIKMMFYGTERSGNTLNKNLRKKYTPWDNSLMAGSLVFEKDNRQYRLERIFGNSNSTDKVTLFDLNLGTSEAVSADIGVKLFGLSLPAFERSIFIGQFGFPEENNLATGELNGKLSNIALTGDETISFDAVNRRLENAKYELMSKSGRSGIYDKNVKLCANLETELENSLQTQQKIDIAKEKVSEISESIKQAQEKANLLKEQLERENDFRNGEKLKELLSLKAELDELNKSLTLSDGTVADEMFVRKAQFCLSKIEKINDKIASKQNECEILENNLNLTLNAMRDATPQKAEELTAKVKDLENQLSLLQEQISNLDNAPAPKPKSLWLVLAIIFALVGVGGYFVNILATVSGLALAVIFAIIFASGASKAKTAIAKNKDLKVELKLKENQLITLISAEKTNLTAITTALNSNTAMIENQKEMLSQNRAQLEDFKSELLAEREILFALFSPFEQTEDLDKINDLLTKIKENATRQKELKQNINYILKDVGNISYDEIKKKLENAQTGEEIDFDKAKEEYEAILQRITDLKTQAATIISEVKTISASAKNPDTIKAEIETLKQKTAAQKEYCDSLNIALEVLSDSYAQVRQSYGSVLEKDAAEIFGALTGGKYSNMTISKSFDISVERTDVFGTKELDYLSSGTVDQAYLSLRLALSKLIADGNYELPIILDDALAQYDDKRTDTAIKFLKEYSKNGQILMFTCHNAVTEIAKTYGANEIRL